jgi:hypothetical protein
LQTLEDLEKENFQLGELIINRVQEAGISFTIEYINEFTFHSIERIKVKIDEALQELARDKVQGLAGGKPASLSKSQSLK